MKIKFFLFKVLNALLNKRGMEIMTKAQLENRDFIYQNASFRDWEKCKYPRIDSIIFSKDRALQLNAFIESYLKKVEKRGTLYVLYTFSPSHADSYKDLRECYENEDIVFVHESNFREQLIDIISHSDSSQLAFYVDDMIFVRDVDYGQLSNLDYKKNVVSLSRGKNLTYSTVLNKSLQLPSFTKSNNLLFYNWDEITEFSDWSYPTGVSGYIYDRREILEIIKSIDFKAPNSLEEKMCRYRDGFLLRHGVCYEEIACVCIHANRVQNEVGNPDLGYFTSEELLQEWNSNKKIDLQPFFDNYKSDKLPLQKYTFVDRK